MSTSKQIVVNMVTGWISIFIRTVIALIMVPFLLNHLGKDGYGLIGLLGVIVSFAAVADLGLRSALGRELAEQVVRKDDQAFGELASTALVLYFCMALVMALIGWILAPWFATVFKIPATLRADAIWMIRIYGSFSVILSFITPVFTAALSSYHRFDMVNTVQVIGGIVSSLLLFAVISSVENALYGWVGVMLIYSLVTLMLTVFCFRRFCEGARIGLGFFNPSRLRPLFHLGGYMYALNLTQALAERSDPLVISYFFGPAGVALYQPGGKLSQTIRPVVLTLANQMYPLATKQHIGRQQDKMQKILVWGTKYTLLIGSLCSACMMAFAEPFCRLWLEKSIGDDYRIAATVMMGWAAADLITYAAGTQWPVLLGMKKLKFLVWSQLPAAIVNILVSIYLVGYTKLGIPGALVATILIGIIRRPLLMWYTAKECGMSLREYFYGAYSRTLCCLTITMSMAFFMKRFCSGWFELIVCTALTGLVWGLACLFIGINKEDIAMFKAAFMKRTRGL
jgi:O-antigen/teichoic acid export membrane protein